MKSLNRIALLIVASTALGGCQALFGGHSRMASQANPWDVERSEAAALVTLEEGKTYLRQGRLAAAIGSFKIAELDPAARAEASNGLAIAYARLGRPDLAKRYFTVAAMLEPDNPKFAANLAKLQWNTALAKSGEAVPARVAKSANVEERQNSVQSQQEPSKGTDSRLERVSKGVVHLRMLDTLQAAPRMSVVARSGGVSKPVSVTARQPAQIAAVDAPKREAVYPIRIELSK